MKIGDRVKFLNQTGGGIVTGFSKKGWVTVEDDQEGFEIPVLEKECVVVEENAAAAQKKNIQTKDGDKLNIALAYSQKGAGFVCLLANECNYSILATYTVCSSSRTEQTKGEYLTLFAGEVLPYERKELCRLSRENLNDFSKRILIRAIPFKKGTGITGAVPSALKPVIEKEFILDPMNLLKESMYKMNDYTPDKSYIIPIVNENVKELPLVQNSEDDMLRQVLKEKFQGGKEPQKKKLEPKAPVLSRTSSSGMLEIDLHASALLETTTGMDNAAILNYQMEKFNETMKTFQRKKGTRIVFIHGKGDGILRKAILKDLKTKYPACKWQDASFKEYGYGATMVTI